MRLSKPIKQYGDFREYPYPLADADHAVIDRAVKRAIADALAVARRADRDSKVNALAAGYRREVNLSL